MENKNDVIDELNDLIEIHNDRITGYEKASTNSHAKLAAIAGEMKAQSEKQKQALVDYVTKLGGNVAEGTTVSGKLFRAWMDIKATFRSDDSDSMLESSIFGEEAAQKAYDMALAEDDLPADVRSLLQTQQSELKASQQKIKALEKAVD